MQQPNILKSQFRLLQRVNAGPSASIRSMSSTTLRDTQTCPLPDGRVLGFAEYGHPNGYPVLFFHGWPSSRLEASGADKIAQRHKLRIIAPDRPGFGISTFQPHRRITDWPADVEALSNHLSLSRFAILGGSGGGPYAIACAHRLPPQKLSSVGVMGGSGPWKAGTSDLSMSTWMMYLGTMYTPTMLRGITNLMVGTLRKIVNTGVVTGWIDNWLKTINDDEGLSLDERRQLLLRVLFEGFAQGSRAFVQEAELLSSQDWGFELEDVAYDRIQIWHGTKDSNAPIGMIRYMAQHLPHAVLTEYHEDDHYTLGNRLEQIMTELTSNQSSRSEGTKLE